MNLEKYDNPIEVYLDRSIYVNIDYSVASK